MSYLLPLLLFPLVVHSSCFAPNGIAELNTAYQPCISISGINSMCCGLNRTIVGGVADICQQDGLCRSSDGGLWRGFCTDKNWSSPGCLPKNICDDGNGGTSSNSNELTKCPDGTYCCGGRNTTCCTNNSGFTLSPTLIALQTTTATPTPSSSITLSPLSHTSPSCTPNTPPSNTPSKTILSLSIALPLTLLAIIGSLLGFYLGQRRGRGYVSASAVSAPVSVFRDRAPASVEIPGNDLDGYYGNGGMAVKSPGLVHDGGWVPQIPQVGVQEMRVGREPVEIGERERGNVI